MTVSEFYTWLAQSFDEQAELDGAPMLEPQPVAHFSWNIDDPFYKKWWAYIRFYFYRGKLPAYLSCTIWSYP